MRAYLLFLAGLPLMAQTETNIACVERLEIPSYPALAKQARIAGAVTATVLLTNDASVGKISSEWTSQSASAKAGAIVTPVVEIASDINVREVLRGQNGHSRLQFCDGGKSPAAGDQVLFQLSQPVLDLGADSVGPALTIGTPTVMEGISR